MKKRKNILAIIAFVAVLLVLNLIFIYSRLWSRQGYASTREEDLQETFLGAFGGGTFFEQTEYQDIVHVKEGNVIVYLGTYSGGSYGDYVVFHKSLVSDRWWIFTRGSISYHSESVLLDEPLTGRIYLSLNARNIARAEIVKDGETTIVDIDPDRPLIVITDGKNDSVTFFSEREKEISEEDFLTSGY